MASFNIHASRALWRRRELYRYKKWQGYVKTKPQGDLLRSKWFNDYVEAKAVRVKRDYQISKLNVTELDKAGENFIIGNEGNVNYVYNDSQGHATVGVGHLLHYGSYTQADAIKWGTRYNPKYTKAEFIVFFRKDAEPYLAAVRKVFKGAKLKCTQNRFNAAASLCFNIGIGGLLSSSFAKSVKAGNADQAYKDILKWNLPPEIRGRRKREADLFARG